MKKKINPFFFKAFIFVFIVAFVFFLLFGAIERINARKATDIALGGFEKDFFNRAQDVQRNISAVKYSLSELAVKIASDKGFEDGTYPENNSLRADMRAILVDRRQAEFSKYLLTAFIIDTEKEDYVYDLTGTFPADVFFNQYYVNDTYTDRYWLTESVKGEGFKIHPTVMFATARDTKRIDIDIMPISYKPQENSRFIIVSLFDINSMADDFGFSAIRSDSDGSFIYKNYGSEESFDNIKDNGYRCVDGDYVFKFSDEQNGNIEIFGVVPGKDVDAVSGNGIGRVIVMLLIIVLFSAAFGVIAGGKYSEIMMSIASEIDKSPAVKKSFGKNTENLGQIYEGIELLAEGSSKHHSSVASGESLLDSMFLQSKVRDVYVGIDDIEERVSVRQSFYMIYLRVNYREEFEEYIGKDLGKATFLLKQLIEMHLESIGADATVFQVENNGIVSVFGGEDSPDDDKHRITEGILAKLENESEYAYFTAVVSETYEGIENIKAVYDDLIDLLRYAKPSAETQLLFAREVRRGASRFYFSVEEMGKFSALLQNGKIEDIIRKLDEILDFNMKKDINNFEMYLLCSEIVNCSVKVVNRVLHAIPQALDLSEVYRELERARTPERYRVICVEFLEKTVEQLRQNEREDDYIISYILDYVDNHYSEDIYLNLFAEKLKLTPAYISSYFKEKMNVNLSDYVNSYRIKKAVELSANPQNKNKDIAVMVGLPNINTFIRLFKKYTGYTPGEYRKKHFGK